MSFFEEIERHTPGRTAVLSGRWQISYGQLNEDIAQMAGWLAAEGLQPGDRVAIFPRHLPRPDYWEWIMQLGAIRAGLVHSIGPQALRAAGAGALGPLAATISTNPDDDSIKAGRHIRFAPATTEPLARQHGQSFTAPPIKAVDQAVRLFTTSGTTGTPKLVAWDKRLMEIRLDEVDRTSATAPGAVLLNLFGLITTTGFRHTLQCWRAGGLAMLRAVGVAPEQSAIDTNRSTHIVASPFRFGRLLGHTQGMWRGKEGRRVELLGGRVPRPLRDEALRRCCASLQSIYGSTEAGVVATCDAGAFDCHAGAAGFVIEGASVEIVDEQGNALPAGQEGIVRARTPGMASHYVGESADAPLLRDGWFHPGDRGILFDDGFLAVTGRVNETINVGGMTFAAAEFEDRLRALPGVADGAIVAVAAMPANMFAIALVLDDGGDLDAIAGDIPRLVPRGFKVRLFRVNELPRNAMGKVERPALSAAITEVLRQEAARARA